MSGISESCSQREGARVDIRIRSEKYTIFWSDEFQSKISRDQWSGLTEPVLRSFKVLADEVYTRESVHLDEELCNQQLTELAKRGGRVYKLFFAQDNDNDEYGPRTVLNNHIAEVKQSGAIPAPTFISEYTPFPWEVLYEGDDYNAHEPEKFWGLAYSPARLLNPRISKVPKEQALPSDMLFCLYHRLRRAHENEWPQIEKLVRATSAGRFNLLSHSGKLMQVQDGETLLDYLDHASHNMLHFACHCTQLDDNSDTLIISMLNTETETDETAPQVIQLETFSFLDKPSRFSRSPLVFLNACNTSGEGGEAHKVLNLPKVFVDRGAAAVIATVCPVPDLFAAEFAKVFYTYFLRGKEEIDPETGKVKIDPKTGQQYYKKLTIGEALHFTRRDFLEIHHNPLGLAYGLYSSAFYQLAQTPMGGRAL